MSLKDCVVVGGLDMQAQAKELARRPHVVIATPGRLRALIQMDADLARAFARARFLGERGARPACVAGREGASAWADHRARACTCRP